MGQGLELLQVIVAQHPSVQPNANTYKALMRACTKDLKAAFSLYDQMLTRGLEADVDIYNILVHIATLEGDFDAAEGVFKTMREQGSGAVKHLGKSYLAYIYNLMRADEADRVFSMLKTMESEWRYPDARAYENMLRFFARKRHMDGQLKCIEAIALENAGGQGIGQVQRQVDISLGVLMMQAQQEKDDARVLKLVDLAQRTGSPLNQRQEVNMVYALLKQGEGLEAFKRALRIFENDGQLPPRMLQALAGNLAEQASAVDDAYYLLESRKADGGAVPLPAVNLIIEACAAMGDLDRAFATWSELDQLALKPDTGTYNALLRTCVETREIASGRRLLNRMQLDEVSPDATTFSHHCSLLVMSRQGDVALGLLQSCRDAGITPDTRMYSTLINLLLRQRRHGQAQELLAEMKASGRVSEAFERKVMEACA